MTLTGSSNITCILKDITDGVFHLMLNVNRNFVSGQGRHWSNAALCGISAVSVGTVFRKYAFPFLTLTFGHGFTKYCPVPSTSSDSCTCKV